MSEEGGGFWWWREGSKMTFHVLWEPKQFTLALSPDVPRKPWWCLRGHGGAS